MPSESRQAPAVGVDRLVPGDHAFLAFSDDDARWDILGVFTQQGFARDEKVLLLVDVDQAPAAVAVRVSGGAVAARRALEAGQLVVSNRPRFSRGAFDAGRLVEAVRRRVDTAVGDGYTGLRSASEMSLALAPVDRLDQALEYEIALHDALFSAPRADRRCTILCQWDERVFGGSPAMDAAHAVHPVTLLDRVGALHVAATVAGIKLTGDSDLSTRAEFSAALRTLADQPQATLVLDIADLSFLDGGSAGAVLRLAADLVPPRRLEIRCRNSQRRMLQLLGARSIPQLSIITDRL